MLYKPVKGFEENYIVYEDGTIVSVKRRWPSHGKCTMNYTRKELKQTVDKKGYLTVKLYDGNGLSKTMKVHRIVAEAFLENPESKECVCHKDNNKQNCHVGNLYWGTNKENQDQAWRDGRHKCKPVAMISKDGTIKEFPSQKEAAIFLGIPASAISACTLGKKKTAYGYMWKGIGG